MAKPLPKTPVAFALRRLLPDDAQTLLLRAALDGDKGAEAWATWRASHNLQATLTGNRAGVKGLLPLLAYNLERNGAEVAADDLSLLRMARYREQLRMERYQTILGQTLAALQTAGVNSILLKGGALTLTTYPEATLRHCHDIDLLVQPRDLPQAAARLLAHDFRYAPAHTPLDDALAAGDLHLTHNSGLPIVLHTRLFRNDFYGMALEDAWQSALPVGKGLAGMMLAPEWELVHIVGAMLCAPSRARVTWVCDAYTLMAAHPMLDWARVCEIARQCRLAMALYAALDYLRQQRQRFVPSFVLVELQRDFAQASWADVAELLQSARRQQAASYGDLFAAATNWQERAALLRWILFPPLPASQRQQASGWQSPLFYLRFNLRRGARFLARRTVAAKPSKGQV